MSAVASIVASKIEPPATPRIPGLRSGVLDGIRSAPQVVAIVAPPGYGKTALAAELFATRPAGSAAWLSVDLIDRQPYVFWSHLIAAVRTTTAGVDDEPMRLLTERGSEDLTFLAALCAQLLAGSGRSTLVLDDVDRIDDPTVMSGLEVLVDRLGDRLELVVTGRVDPLLPLARWRSTGRLVDVRQSDLRLDRAAARRFVEALAPGLLSSTEIDSLNDRVEGWPVGLQIALLVARSADDPAAAVRDIVDARRIIADYLRVEVLDRLTDAQREIALGLSIHDWWDHDLCRRVLGDRSVPIVRELRDRQVLTVELREGDGFRFHALVREILERELRWRDPSHHDDLHRRVAEVLAERGDVLAAGRHFSIAGDHDRAGAVIAAPAMELVDAGQVDELRVALAMVPTEAAITSPERMIDLALAHVLTGQRAGAERWVARATDAVSEHDDRLRLRLGSVRLAERALLGDLTQVDHIIAATDQLRAAVDDDWPLARRHDSIVARCAVWFERPDAAARVANFRASPAPSQAIDVLGPALEAVLALAASDVAGASRLATVALDRSTRLPSDGHPAMVDALVAAASCGWAVGDLDRAREFADRARSHPFAGFPLFDLLALEVSCSAMIAAGAASDALALVDDVEVPTSPFLRSRASAIRSRALLALGRFDEARESADLIVPGPTRDLAVAWSALRLDHADEAGALIAGADRWPVPLRIEASLITSMLGRTSDDVLSVAVTDAAAAGWVGPFLGHGPDVDARLRRLPLDVLHPRLASVLGGTAPTPTSPSYVRMTGRELSLLELLPTHLSYAQMGEQLYVSVNTVKSNLKVVYRKLGATTRDDAIRAARRAGLLSSDV